MLVRQGYNAIGTTRPAFLREHQALAFFLLLRNVLIPYRGAKTLRQASNVLRYPV